MAIGNGEKCPWCEHIMKDFKINGQDSTQHFIDNHKEEFMKSIYG